MSIPFHQGLDGNVPMAMTVNIWSLRFLRGDAIAQGPPMIAADLKAAWVKDTVRFQCTGMIRNLSDRPLRNLNVSTRQGNGKFALFSTGAEISAIPPHGQARVVADLSPAANSTPAQPLPMNSYYYNNSGSTPTESEVGPLAGELNVRRMKRIEALVKEGGQACILGELADPAPAATLAMMPDRQKHWQYIRAVVGVGQESK